MANTIQITIRQDNKGNAISTVTKQLGQLDNAAGSSSGVMSKLSSTLGGLGKIAAGVSVAGVLALGAGLAKVVQTGLSFNNSMEQAAARINAFTKDASLTADILETVRDRASKTPFAFEEMANSAAALMPTVRASGESLEYLLQQAEILAASNPMEGLQGASFALKEAVSGDFTSIIERFNLSRTTLNELKEQGVPALEAVGIAMQEMGLDTDLVSALAETAEGRWSTFKDTLTTLAGIVTQPIFDTLSQSLGDINAWLVQVGPQLEAFATVLANDVANGIARIQELVSAFQTGGAGGLLAALGFSPEALDFIGASIAYITEQFTQLTTALDPSLASFQESLSRLSVTFNEAGVNGQTLTQALLAQADFILNTVIPTWIQWVGFLSGVAASAFSAWVTYIQTAYSAWQAFSGFIQSDVVPALLAINDGIAVVTSVLVPLGELINAVINKALQAMAGLWQNVLWPALQKVGNLLKDTIMPSFTSLGEAVNEDISPSLKDFGEVVLPLLQEGLEFVTESIKDVIGYFESLKESVNSFSLPEILTPGSPPPMAYALMDIASGADQAAKAVELFGAHVAGAGKFIDDLNMGGFARKFNTGGGQWRNFRNIIKNQIGGSFEQLMTSGMSPIEILDKIHQTAARFHFPPSMASEFAMAEGLIEHLTSSVTEFQTAMRIENMGRMLQMGSQFSGIGGSLAGMLQEQMSSPNSFMADLKAFLNDTSQQFFTFTDEVGTWQFDRNTAQARYNELLEDQTRQEALITQQKEQQQKLSFLQSQLDLIKLGRELGGNLFQGITFGLDASVEDLLAATNAVTEAMINQINRDLQIASPSKVLFRIFRDQVGGAMAGGLLAAKPMLQGVISPVLNPIMEGASAAGKVVNNYFNQTVNTNADQSTVIGDFRTMQLMAGS